MNLRQITSIPPEIRKKSVVVLCRSSAAERRLYERERNILEVLHLLLTRLVTDQSSSCRGSILLFDYASFSVT